MAFFEYYYYCIISHSLRLPALVDNTVLLGAISENFYPLDAPMKSQITLLRNNGIKRVNRELLPVYKPTLLDSHESWIVATFFLHTTLGLFPVPVRPQLAFYFFYILNRQNVATVLIFCLLSETSKESLLLLIRLY